LAQQIRPDNSKLDAFLDEGQCMSLPQAVKTTLQALGVS